MFLRTQNDIANLKKLERVRTEFLGNVSHELRTPIFAIQGYLETLLNGAIDDKKVNRNFLEKANHHTNNLNTLLNELIDISMIESGQMHMSFRYFNIAEYLEEICNDLRPQADEKNLQQYATIPTFDNVSDLNNANGFTIALGQIDSSGNITGATTTDPLTQPINYFHITSTSNATTGGVSGGGENCSAGPVTLEVVNG